jgi:biotin carboxyl carrier protein
VRYEVTHGRETFNVELREVSPNVYEIRVGDDGELIRVDACKTARTVYSLLVGSKQFEGSVDVRDDSMLNVHVGTSAFEFTVMDERRKLLVGGVDTVAGGRQEVRAQMPGKIVKILVQVGQEVETDQGLVVVEAMKMENELRSSIDGVVAEIAVEEGAAVETGTLLIVVEPLAED